MSVRVLVVEDEENLRNLLKGYLKREGFEVYEVADGDLAIEVAHSAEPDVVILDWMLPGRDGMEVLREIRRFSKAYVLMLTARAEETDKIVGLRSGADDYLTKPFSPDELVTRVHTMLRRPRGSVSAVPEEPPARFGELLIDPGTREVRVQDELVSLTALEFDLLRTLASRPGFVFSRSRLLDRAWGTNYFVGEHAVDQHVTNLRKKLDDDPARPHYIETVRGVGYRFVRQ